MANLPDALENLIGRLGRLPGVGRRGAERMAFALLAEQGDPAELATALARLVDEVGTCEVCGYFTDRGRCPVCSDRSRDDTTICVVEDALDVVAFEKAGGYRGVYHVMGGLLSPLKGITPDDLRFAELAVRLDEGRFDELILGTSPSVEGDATALYLSRTLARDGLRFSRIGRGVPMGGSLEMADGGTLRMALESRRRLDEP